MPSVSVPHEFFIKERSQIYADWPTAFFRELLQNSIDAGAGVIQVKIEPTDEPMKARVFFKDDGCGMSREVLEEVFFALGKTTKGSDAVGGFGRARLLTCFGQHAYEIEVGNLHVSGVGGWYEITETASRKQGTAFNILTATSPDRLTHALERVLRKSNFQGQFIWEGGPAIEPYRAGRRIREIEFSDGTQIASVFVNKSGGFPGYVVYRVSGLEMFSYPVIGAPQVTIEILPSQAKGVLTANRDGLNASVQPIISRFQQDLLVNSHQALRDAKRDKSRLQMAKPFEKSPGFTMTADDRTAAGVFSSSPGTQRKDQPGVPATIVSQGSQGASTKFYRVGEKVAIPRQGYPSFWLEFQDVEGPSLRAMRRGIPAFLPENWIDQAIIPSSPGYLQFARRHAQSERLLLAWTEACRAAVFAYVASCEPMPFNWMPGWVFADPDQLRGMYREVTYDNNLVGAFLLNPLSSSGCGAYNLSSKSYLKEILSIAVHEVAHHRSGYHGEDFCRTMTKIVGALDQASALRAMAAVRLSPPLAVEIRPAEGLQAP